MSRQKGAHNSAKAAEVEAVGATGHGSGARVAGEGGSDGAGGLDVVYGVSYVVVTNAIEVGEGVLIIKILIVPQGLNVFFETLVIGELLPRPRYVGRSRTRIRRTPPVEVRQSNVKERQDGQENNGTFLTLSSLETLPLGVGLVGGFGGKTCENARSRGNKLLKTRGQFANERF
ncbi:uncharacterized protein BcabD6B2_41150 [Babesia caballi]|uniref:Uncharacterized protein n=1 Tax=Babesia caballi TaxID=5871 RepID=A0AAV4LYJ3_BABCB|nr:hypothetical protein BcabD6B2_41150 [Babesia caballi]